MQVYFTTFSLQKAPAFVHMTNAYGTIFTSYFHALFIK